MFIPFEELNSNSRIWIYQSNRLFSEVEKEEISSLLENFCNSWVVHGQALPTSFEIRYNQFILLAADESNLQASGCSIDSSVRLIKEIEQKFSVNLFDRLNIAYKLQGELSTCNINTFKQLLTEGKADGNTIVFNNMVEVKKDLEDKWEIPVVQSWHRQLLGV